MLTKIPQVAPEGQDCAVNTGDLIKTLR